MIRNLPPLRRALPDRSASRNPMMVLNESVGQQIYIGCKLPTLEGARLPNVFMRCRVAFLKNIQHLVMGIPCSRCAHFPEISGHHALKIHTSGATFRTVKDRFPRR